MRIALNARILQAPRTGIGHYVAELVGALACEPDVELSLFHGWGWSSSLPDAAMPGYSRLSPLLRQIPGAYQARRWLAQKRFDQADPSRSIFITNRVCGRCRSMARQSSPCMT